MVLLTMGTTEILVLIGIGIIVTTLIGYGILHYVKIKMEREIEKVEIEQHEDIPQSENTVSTPSNNVAEIEEEVSEQTEKSLSEIEILLKEMQSDLDKHKNDPVHTFEEEQEEKAIISYQELKQATENVNLATEVSKYEKEQEELAASSVPQMMEEISSKKEEVSKPVKSEKTGFSSSEFISPVYGKMESKEPDYPKIPNFKEEFNIHHNNNSLQFDDVKVNLKRGNKQSLEDTFNTKPIDDETKSNEEFLSALKEFRNNLE